MLIEDDLWTNWTWKYPTNAKLCCHQGIQFLSDIMNKHGLVKIKIKRKEWGVGDICAPRAKKRDCT